MLKPKTLNVSIPRPSLPCQVIIGKGILENLPKNVDLSPHNQLILVADENLKKLANQLQKLLSRSGSKIHARCEKSKGTPMILKGNCPIKSALSLEASTPGVKEQKKVHLFFIKAGEENKNEAQANALLNKILKVKPPLDRTALIIAFGGGVIGDLVGYVAGKILRGLALIQIPTTLLAMVDSSLGGKTAVDSDKGLTNMIGLFHLPSAVVMDIKVLETLPEKGWQEGLSELVKHAFLDKKLFDFLFEHPSLRDSNLSTPGVDKETPGVKGKGIGELRKNEPLIQVLTLSAKFKFSIVAKDFEEKTGARKVLNLGHTFGRALETASNFRLTHGQAVALGLHAALKASFYKKLLKKEILNKCLHLLKKFNLLNHTRCEKSKGTPMILKGNCPIKSALSLEAFTPGVKELVSDVKISINSVKKAIKHDKKAILGRPKFVLLEDIGKPKIDCHLEEKLIDKVLKEITNPSL